METISRRPLIIWICFFTISTGLLILFQQPHLVVLANPHKTLLGACMIISSVIKMISIVFKKRHFRKWSLISIFIEWLVLVWAYAYHPMVNMGWMLSAGLAGVVLIALWRSDFRRDE